MGRFSRYGGPLTYLILTSLLLLGVLVILDFGLGAFKIANMRRRPSNLGASTDKEKRSVAALDVHNVSKKFRRAKTHAVEDVSFEVNGGTVFALLGPNGAGKTTLFNIIRGELRPTRGDVFINEASITNSSRLARLSLGVCPQFTAIDSELTVREHLAVYGRLKGLSIKHVDGDVEDLLKATDLITYADRLASQLSGGNQRKLALAICLIGDVVCPRIDLKTKFPQVPRPSFSWTSFRRALIHEPSARCGRHSNEYQKAKLWW
jgi:ATP-binding cassette, subfamily A (ABC1), member 3